MKRRKANWICHTLRRNCLLKHVIEGKIEGRIEVRGRRGRRLEQLLDDLNETKRYWKLKEEELAPVLWNVIILNILTKYVKRKIFNIVEHLATIKYSIYIHILLFL
jgi:hypothetical protein